MPGKYLEYIKAGRYVIPVELSFLPSKVEGEREVTTKWVERRHWKEVKALLKEAVEKVGKYNEQTSDKINKSPHIGWGQEVAVGYLILLNKDKCPFVAVLDPKKNCWTDDEEDMEIDENSGIADFGGKHRSFTPTKCYIKACIVKRTTSKTEDGKKLGKELGVSKDDLRNYFPVLFNNTSGSSSSNTTGHHSSSPGEKQHKQPSKNTNKKKPVPPKKKPIVVNREDTFLHDDTYFPQHDFTSSDESLIDLPPPGAFPPSSTTSPSFNKNKKKGGKGGPGKGVTEPLVVNQCQNLPDYIDTDGLVDIGEEIDIYANEIDNEVRDDIFSEAVDEVFSSSNLFRSWIADDDDDSEEELPDIEETTSTVRKPLVNNRRQRRRREKSPAKSGLPDIDEPGRRKTKKKRNVAIVEPMNKSSTSGGSGGGGVQQSPHDNEINLGGIILAPPTKKSRARCPGSPTIERLLGGNSRSRNTESAIEILADDVEMPSTMSGSTDSHSSSRPSGSANKNKKDVKEPLLRRPNKIKKKKKKVHSSEIRKRKRPQPELEEEEDGNLASDETTDSEREMPVLIRMVLSPGSRDHEDQEQEDTSGMTPPDSPPYAIPVLEPIITLPAEENSQERSNTRTSVSGSEVPRFTRRRSLSPDIIEQCSQAYRQGQGQGQPRPPRPFLSQQKKRVRHASDSDVDITYQSGYKKAILWQNKNKKRKNSPFLTRPSSASSSSSHMNFNNNARPARPPPRPLSPSRTTTVSMMSAIAASIVRRATEISNNNNNNRPPPQKPRPKKSGGPTPPPPPKSKSTSASVPPPPKPKSSGTKKRKTKPGSSPSASSTRLTTPPRPLINLEPIIPSTPSPPPPPPPPSSPPRPRLVLVTPTSPAIPIVPSTSKPSTSSSSPSSYSSSIAIKMERIEASQNNNNYNSDTAPPPPAAMDMDEDNHSSEDDNDSGSDEVLFAGQYQAIPVLTLDSPPRQDEEDSDDDLFSFERPASVKVESSQSKSQFMKSMSSTSTMSLSTPPPPPPVVTPHSSSSFTNNPPPPPPRINNNHDNTTTAPPEDEYVDYSFNFVERSLGSGRRNGGGGSQTVINALSDRPNTNDDDNEEGDTSGGSGMGSGGDEQMTQHVVPPPNSQENERVNTLSTYQLMNHPGTLHAGFGFLNRVMSNDTNAYKRLGIERRNKDRGEKQSDSSSDRDLMPPPPPAPTKRPASPDICSLNPEEQLRKRPGGVTYGPSSAAARIPQRRMIPATVVHPQGMPVPVRPHPQPRRSGSPVPGPSSGIRNPQFYQRRVASTEFSEDHEHDSEEMEQYHRTSTDTDPFFQEFMSRAQQEEQEYEPQGDEYDLTQSSQCMLSVVQDYAEKSRQCKKHKKNVQDLTVEQFREHFEAIQPQILSIFEGKTLSVRNKLYCSKRHHEIRTLKGIHVIRPFNEEHGNIMNIWLYDLLVPFVGSTLKCADYVNYVMRPEALIRIYANLNNISIETAEKEMLAGPCYEGPYLES